jgi:K+/H+ antiporter YhaU regulatory subunit KhtT
MSRAVVIDYQALGMEVRATCEHVGKQLDKALGEIKATLENASLLVDESVRSHEKHVARKADTIRAEVSALMTAVEDFQRRERKQVNNHSTEYTMYLAAEQNIISKTQSILQKTGKIMTDDLYGLQTMIDEAFVERSRTLRDRAKSPGNAIDYAFANKLAQVDDVLLRDAIYRFALKTEYKDLSFEQFVSMAEASLKKEIAGHLEEKRQEITDDVRREMEENQVSSEVIASATSARTIEEMQTLASKAIIGEKVRKETLKAVIAAIRARGFIVKNDSIRLDRENDQVILVAQKASGQRAQFKIHLDGRFIYAFDGYEGQACQEDIQPFMEDLEAVYGMKMTERDIMWENPDKISSMRYQSQKTGKTGQ